MVGEFVLFFFGNKIQRICFDKSSYNDIVTNQD